MSQPVIVLKRGSLTEGDELVLVNASNTNANLGSGVSGAIRAACGAGYQESIHRALEAARGGPMEPGDAFVTDAGSHSTARWVVHAAVMDYRHGSVGDPFPDRARIRRCLEKTWQCIESIDHPALSVALPALGAGTGQLGVRVPTELACSTLKEHLQAVPESRISRVSFYGYGLDELVAIAEVVEGHFSLPRDGIPEELRDPSARPR